MYFIIRISWNRRSNNFLKLFLRVLSEVFLNLLITQEQFNENIRDFIFFQGVINIFEIDIKQILGDNFVHFIECFYSWYSVYIIGVAFQKINGIFKIFFNTLKSILFSHLLKIIKTLCSDSWIMIIIKNFQKGNKTFFKCFFTQLFIKLRDEFAKC